MKKDGRDTVLASTVNAGFVEFPSFRNVLLACILRHDIGSSRIPEIVRISSNLAYSRRFLFSNTITILCGGKARGIGNFANRSDTRVHG